MSHSAPIQTKICGLRTEQDVETAARAGAGFVGFMHYPKSPRHIEPEAAEKLARLLPGSVKAVSVLVDPDDEAIARVSGWTDYIQLHGQETPRRTREIAGLSGKPLIKAVTLASKEDLGAVELFRGIAEILLFDAKPPTSGPDGQPGLPGGNAVAFDWHILAATKITMPWMLSGGLTPDNVSEAIRLTGARMVDVSSGVEETRGVKSPEKIKAFLRAVQETSVS